jgi:hypothetical protein
VSIQKIKEILANTEYTNGSNLSNAREIHEQRIRYNNKHGYKQNSIDLQSKRSFYGRLDLQQDTIYPDINKMVNLRSNGRQKNVLVLPFVNDAFQELEAKVNDLIKIGKLIPNQLLPISAEEVYFDLETNYQNNIKQILDAFFQYSINNGEINIIKNFKDFINQFMNFVSLSNISLTMTKYCIAKSNISSTGLIIHTKKQVMDLDMLKDLFYSSESYETYSNLLLTYGFSVDKFAPWRIIFNIDSKIAQSYMSKYDIKNTNDLFDNFYKKTYETDMSILIENLLLYYNDRICVLKPQLFETKIKQSKQGFKSFFATTERLTISEENIYKLIPEVTLLKLYFYIRLKEESFNLSQEEFDGLMTKVTILHQTSGVNGVNDFVNEYTKFSTNDGANASLSLTREGVTRYNNLNVYFRV